MPGNAHSEDRFDGAEAIVSHPLIVVAGVSASGKTTVGTLLARSRGVPFCEGDGLHPAANVAKMKAGIPLDDVDRAPWLDRVRAWLFGHRDGGVVSCSALKRSYRDRLREGLAPPPAFVLLDPPRDVLRRRLEARRDHFMPPSLLATQLEALERPNSDENLLHLMMDEPPDKLVAAVDTWLAR